MYLILIQRPPPGFGFLLFNQNIFRQTLSENSCPFKRFFMGCTYEKNQQI